MAGRVATTVVCILAVSLAVSHTKAQASCDPETGYLVVSTNKNTNVQETKDGRIVTDTVTTILKKGNCSSGSFGQEKQLTQDSKDFDSVNALQHDQHTKQTKQVKDIDIVSEKDQKQIKSHSEQEQKQNDMQPSQQHTKASSPKQNPNNEPITQMVVSDKVEEVRLQTYYVANLADEKGTGEITVSYKLLRGNKVATEKSYTFPLLSGTQTEATQIFDKKRAFFEKRYWMDNKSLIRSKHEERYSYILKPPGQIKVFYEKYTDGDLVIEESKMYPISDNSQSTTLEILMQYREYIIDESKRAGTQQKFLYTTSQGMIVGEGIEYREKISFTANWRGFFTVFYKLYNTDGRLTFRKAQTNIIREGKQHEVDRYIREAGDLFHNGEEDSDVDVGGNGTYREKFFYKPGETDMEIEYSLYKRGKLVHKDELSFLGVPKSQNALDNIMNYYIDTVHKQRMEIDDNNEIEEQDRKNDEEVDEKDVAADEPIDYKDDYIIETSHAEIIGTGLKFKEVFSYTAGQGEMTVFFKLLNTNGRVVFSESKKYSLPNDDQSEIDQNMKAFVQRIHNGVKETNADGENNVVLTLLPMSEQLNYEVGPTELTTTYEYRRFGKPITTKEETFPTPIKTQWAYDRILYEYLEALHREREAEYRLLHRSLGLK